MSITEAALACATCGYPRFDHRRSDACPTSAAGDGHACWCVGGVYAPNVRPTPVVLTDVVHGIPASYHDGCRCQDCTIAIYLYNKDHARYPYRSKVAGS